MRDELRLFEQTVPDVGTVLSFPISLTQTTYCPHSGAASPSSWWGDMSYEILNLINLYWVGFYYARWGKLHLGISPNHLESDLSYVQSKYQSIHGYFQSSSDAVTEKKWNHYSETIERTFIGLGMFFCSKLNGFIKYHILVGTESRVYWQASLIRVVVIYY